MTHARKHARTHARTHAHPRANALTHTHAYAGSRTHTGAQGRTLLIVDCDSDLEVMLMATPSLRSLFILQRVAGGFRARSGERLTEFYSCDPKVGAGRGARGAGRASGGWVGEGHKPPGAITPCWVATTLCSCRLQILL